MSTKVQRVSIPDNLPDCMQRLIKVGVSLITQLFYLGVFCARYLPPQLWQSYDIVTFHKVWNTSLKIFYVLSSAYIIFIMTRIYARTRERERAAKMGAYCLFLCLVTSPFMMMTFKDKELWTFAEVGTQSSFSRILTDEVPTSFLGLSR